MNRERNIRFMATHHAIQEALLSLIHQKRKVTVNAICEYAGINCSAFYLHYNDIQSLLAEIQNNILRKRKSLPKKKCQWCQPKKEVGTFIISSSRCIKMAIYSVSIHL